jgi:hypothetical protein
MTARTNEEAMPLAASSPLDGRGDDARNGGDERDATDPGPAPGDPARPRVDTLPDGMELADVDRANLPPPTQGEGPRPELVAIPYEPSTNNEDYNRLLNMLSPPATAPAIQSPTTDGELAAQYDAGSIPLARRSPTPVPEPRVLLNCTGEIAPRGPGAVAYVAGRSAPPPEDRTRPTVTIVRTRSMLPGVLLGAAATALLLFLFVCVGVALRERHRSPSSTTEAQAGRAALLPSPRAAGPDIPPPPPELGSTSAVSALSSTTSALVAAPRSSVSGGPVRVPAVATDKTDAPARLPVESPPASRKIEREL